MSPTAAPSPETAEIGSFLERLAARTAAPGGGAAAGLAAALAAALLSMVASFTTGERFADVDAQMRAYVDELAALRQRALDTMRADEEAFGTVVDAYGMAKGTEEERARRSAAIQAGLQRAAGPPEALGEVCGRLAELASILAEKGNRSALGDVGTGAACAAAALEGARVNVVANAAQITDASVRARLSALAERMGEDLAALGSVVEDVVRTSRGSAGTGERSARP